MLTRRSVAYALGGALALTCSASAQEKPKPAPAKPAAGPQEVVADEPAEEGRSYRHEPFMLRSVDPKTKRVTESHFFRVGHLRGNDLAKMLGDMQKIHRVAGLQFHSYEKDHLFVVSGPPESVRWARQLLDGLDRPEPQVRIQATIIEVEFGAGLETGLQTKWDRKTADRTFFRGYDAVFNPDSFITASTKRPFQGITGNFDTLGSPNTQARVGDLDIAIRAVQAKNRVHVLSRPYGIVKNGEKLTLSSGVKILVPNSVRFDAASNPITTLRLESVVTKIDATPHILGPNTVEVQLTISVQDLLRETPPEEIKISQREIKSKVILDAGENYLALGGLTRKRSEVRETGVPLLSDIPLLGYLFKSYSRTTTTTELHVYIRVFIEPAGDLGGDGTLMLPPELRGK